MCILTSWISIIYAQDELYVEKLHSVYAFRSGEDSSKENEPTKRTFVSHGALSQKQGLVVVVSNEKTMRLFSIPSLKPKSEVINLSANVADIAFSLSGAYLAIAFQNGRVDVYDVSKGTVFKKVTAHSQPVNAVYLQDENLIFSGGAGRTLLIYDFIADMTIGSVPYLAGDITAVAVQLDAVNCAVGLSQGGVSIVSIDDLSILLELSDAKSKVTKLCYSPDGKYLVAGTDSGNIILWDAKSYEFKNSFTLSGSICAISFDPKMRWLVATSIDSSIAFYDLKRMLNIKLIKEDEHYSTYAEFIDNNTLLTGTSDGKIETWKISLIPPDSIKPCILMENPPHGVILTKVYAKDYQLKGIVYDNLGIKNATINNTPVDLKSASIGSLNINLDNAKDIKVFEKIVNLDSVGINRFKIVLTDKANNSNEYQIEVQRLDKTQALEIIEPPNNSEVADASIPLRFRAWFDIAKYSIVNNMVDIVVDQVPLKYSIGDEVLEYVSIFPGYNQIKLFATSKSGEIFSKLLSLNRVAIPGPATYRPAISLRSDTVSREPQKWAVVVGISKYLNQAIPQLKYADKDAQTLAEVLRECGYDSSHIKILLNEEATVARVKDVFNNFLSNALDTDMIVIYFACHGIFDPDNPQNIYLLAYDSDLNVLGNTALPVWYIRTVLTRNLRMNRVIIFADVCHAQSISSKVGTRGTVGGKKNPVNQYLMELGNSRRDVIVFTASSPGELSKEVKELGQGAFTYYLVNGLRGKADLNGDYIISIGELVQYVRGEVKQKTRNSQNPAHSNIEDLVNLTICGVSH